MGVDGDLALFVRWVQDLSEETTGDAVIIRMSK